MDKAAMRRRNRALWMEALSVLPKPAPVSATWVSQDDLLTVLTPFIKCASNHCLLPTSGGVDIVAVQPSHEKGCIELVLSKHAAYVVRPKCLRIEHFPGAPLETFLLIELGNFEPTDVHSDLDRPREELVDVCDRYIERFQWDNANFFQDEDGSFRPLPRYARLVTRFLSGTMMVVSKGSIWNGIPATYDGRHSRMRPAEIRNQIERILACLGKGYLERYAAISYARLLPGRVET